MELTRTLILTSLVLSALGCGPRGGGRFAPATAAVASPSPAPCLPRRQVKPVVVEQRLKVGRFALDGGADVTWDDQSFVCVAGESDASPAPEVALLVGDIDRGAYLNRTLFRLVKNLGAASAAIGRRGCVYVLSPANLTRLAERSHLERVVLLGRGQGGDVGTIFGQHTISPDRLMPFASARVLSVHAFANQMSAKPAAWRRLFARSPRVTFNFDHELTSSARALTLIEDYFDEVRECRL